MPKKKFSPTGQHTTPTTFLAFLMVTYYLRRGLIFSMSTSFRLTSKSTGVICPSSDIAPIIDANMKFIRSERE